MGYPLERKPRKDSQYETFTLWISDGGGTIYVLESSVTTGQKFLLRVPNASARPQFLMVDIIGSLDAMPDEWKTNGIPGNCLAVGEDGNSLIPDGTQKQFKASRKVFDCYQVLETSDKGITWYERSQFNSHFESAGNVLSHNPDASTRM